MPEVTSCDETLGVLQDEVSVVSAHGGEFIFVAKDGI